MLHETELRTEVIEGQWQTPASCLGTRLTTGVGRDGNQPNGERQDNDQRGAIRIRLFRQTQRAHEASGDENRGAQREPPVEPRVLDSQIRADETPGYICHREAEQGNNQQERQRGLHRLKSGAAGDHLKQEGRDEQCRRTMRKRHVHRPNRTTPLGQLLARPDPPAREKRRRDQQDTKGAAHRRIGVDPESGRLGRPEVPAVLVHLDRRRGAQVVIIGGRPMPVLDHKLVPTPGTQSFAPDQLMADRNLQRAVGAVDFQENPECLPGILPASSRITLLRFGPF